MAELRLNFYDTGNGTIMELTDDSVKDVHIYLWKFLESLDLN